MRLLVFQHSAGEPPAAFGAHAIAAGDPFACVRLFAGEPVPDLAAFDGLLVMGGPMDVWEEDAHAWLAPEKTAIRQWVQSGKPFLGICLGHQLLAEALGGMCKRMAVPEIGVRDVTVSAATGDPVLAAFPASFAAMHWHSVEVVSPPENAQILAFSDRCANQIMRVGSRAWGLQFHPELEHGTITQWMKDPANVACASDWLGGAGAAWEFVETAETGADQFLARSQKLYQAFRSLV